MSVSVRVCVTSGTWLRSCPQDWKAPYAVMYVTAEKLHGDTCAGSCLPSVLTCLLQRPPRCPCLRPSSLHRQARESGQEPLQPGRLWGVGQPEVCPLSEGCPGRSQPPALEGRRRGPRQRGREQSPVFSGLRPRRRVSRGGGKDVSACAKTWLVVPPALRGLARGLGLTWGFPSRTSPGSRHFSAFLALTWEKRKKLYDK